MRIMLAIDRSPYAETAVRAVERLELPKATEVTIVTVVPDPSLIEGISLDRFWGKPKDKESLREAQHKAARDLLTPVSRRLGESGLNTEMRIRWGKTAEEIIAECRRTGADLVVFGAKGEGNSRYFPLGGVASRLLRQADCSALLVRNVSYGLNRIVLAVDGSQSSQHAVQFLTQLPLPHSWDIFLVSSLHSHTAFWPQAETKDHGRHVDMRANLQMAEEIEAQRLLDGTEEQLRQMSYNVSSFIRKGEPAEEILATAETVAADFVVLGARGVNSSEDFAMGSVAQKVTRYANTSVLLVRPARDEQAGGTE